MFAEVTSLAVRITIASQDFILFFYIDNLILTFLQYRRERSRMRCDSFYPQSDIVGHAPKRCKSPNHQPWRTASFPTKLQGYRERSMLAEAQQFSAFPRETNLPLVGGSRKTRKGFIDALSECAVCYFLSAGVVLHGIVYAGDQFHYIKSLCNNGTIYENRCALGGGGGGFVARLKILVSIADVRSKESPRGQRYFSR